MEKERISRQAIGKEVLFITERGNFRSNKMINKGLELKIIYFLIGRRYGTVKLMELYITLP